MKRPKLATWAFVVAMWCAVAFLPRPAPLLSATEIGADVVGAGGGDSESGSYAVTGTFGQGAVGETASSSSFNLRDGFWGVVASGIPIPGDTIPPGKVIDFAVLPLDTAISLQWTNPGDSDFAGTLIRYSTTGFPSTPTDGEPVENGENGMFYNTPGSSEAFTHTSLTNGTTYYYTAFAFDASMNFAEGVGDSATPFDGIAPSMLAFGTISVGDMTVTLRWTNPADGDFDHTVIRYSTSGYPSGPTDGAPVENGNDGHFPNEPASVDSFVHTGLTNGVTYYYSAFAADEVPNYSIPDTVSAIPQDTIPPAVVTILEIDPLPDGSVRLTWRNPSDSDFEGTLIRYSTTSYPTSVNAGDPVPNGNDGMFPNEPASSDTFIHSGLATGEIYYYAVFTYDEVPNYSPPVTGSVVSTDEVAPDLTLSVLQNPYITNHLDIYLVSSEALIDTSIYCALNDAELSLELVDGEQHVWKGDYDLYSTGTLNLYARARDMALNFSEESRPFSSTLILADIGGVAQSVDGRLEIAFSSGCMERDTYVLILDGERSSEGGTEMEASYSISPLALGLGDYAEMAISYDEALADPQHLAIAEVTADKTIPLESFVDTKARCLIAYISHLGTFGVVYSSDIETPVYGVGDFELLQNVPNPFATSTIISFITPRAGHVRAEVVTIDGRRVRRLCDRSFIPGRHTIKWDGTDDAGRRVAGGVYFYRITFESSSLTKKMVFLQ